MYYKWPEDKLREHYSTLVAFYAHLMSCDLTSMQRLIDELKYLIEDAFDEMTSRQADWGDDYDQDDFERFFEARKRYRQEHPEWYAEDALRFGVL